MSDAPPSNDGLPDQPLEDSPRGSAEDQELIITAELVDQPPPVALKPTLPHPNLGFACIWAMVPTAAQFSIGVIIATVMSVGAMPTGAARSDESLWDLNAWLVPVGTFTTVMVALGITAMFFGKRWSRNVAWRNCTATQWMLVVLLVFPLGILASEVSNVTMDAVSLLGWEWLERFHRTNSESFAEFAREAWWVILLGGCILPAVGEELYCRAFLGRGLVARHGVVGGVIWTSVLFGAMHLDPVQSVAACFLGFGLHYAYLTTRSIAAPVTVHLLNNSIAFLLMRDPERFPIPGLVPLPEGQELHTPIELTLAALAALLAVAWALYETRTRWLLAHGKSWDAGYPTAESPPPDVPAQATSGRLRGPVILALICAYAALCVALWAAHGG